MLSWIREKFGAVVISAIISLIAVVFIFSGVFSPKATRGLHEGAVAGTVNGDAISIADFNRELNRRLEFFKNLGGGKLSDEQLKAFRVREGVFQELVNRKLMLQEAERQSLVASDEEVKEKIREIPAFQKDGKFDLVTYKQVLQANQYTTGGFEKLVREDISSQQWGKFFRDRIRVSEEEIKREFLVSQEKRNIKYVLFTQESAKKKISVDLEEVKKFLADPSKVNLAKLKYEEEKGTTYKGLDFEKAKDAVARSILAGEKLNEIQKINQGLADQVLAQMNSSAPDAKINALLKPYDLQVKTTGLFTRDKSYVPGIGDSKELLADAFSSKGPINAKQGGKAKKYPLADRLLVAVVTEVQNPDLSKLDSERPSLIQRVLGKKEREIYQEWMKKLTAQAKIDSNPAVISE